MIYEILEGIAKTAGGSLSLGESAVAISAGRWADSPPAAKSVKLPCSTLFCVRAIPHKDCAADASSNFSSDETKSGVNTCCIHEHFCEI